MYIANNDLINITGGGITSAFITSIVRLFSTVVDFGRMVGSSIRMIVKRDYC